MSVKVTSLVWDRFPTGGHTLLAMLALADWSNDWGECYPSMSTIAARLRVSRSQAQRTVHALLETGLVEVIGNHSGGAPGTSRRYRINLSALALQSPARAKGSTKVTGGMDIQDGPHGNDERGSTYLAQTVNEPSFNHLEGHSKKKSPRNDIPIVEIVELYNRELGSMLPMAITLNANRKRAISARWQEMLNSLNPGGQIRYVDRATGLDWWCKFFRKVRSNPHWMGENNIGWTADLDWLTTPRNFTKVLEFRPARKGEER